MPVNCLRRWPNTNLSPGLLYTLHKHEAFNQFCFNVDPQSSTLARQWNSIGWLYRLFWRLHYAGDALISAPEKWNESGFRPLLCTYRLNWARRTSWGWWDDWDDTVLQTQDSKFESWRSEAEHATSRSRRLPTILTFTRGWGRNIFCLFQTAETGNRTPNSGVKGSAVLTTTLGPPPHRRQKHHITRYISTMLMQCWATVCDAGPTLFQPKPFKLLTTKYNLEYFFLNTR